LKRGFQIETATGGSGMPFKETLDQLVHDAGSRFATMHDESLARMQDADCE